MARRGREKVAQELDLGVCSKMHSITFQTKHFKIQYRGVMMILTLLYWILECFVTFRKVIEFRKITKC